MQVSSVEPRYSLLNLVPTFLSTTDGCAGSAPARAAAAVNGGQDSHSCSQVPAAAGASAPARDQDAAGGCSGGPVGNPGSFPGIHPGVVALLLVAKCSDLNRAACVTVLRKFNSVQKDRPEA